MCKKKGEKRRLQQKEKQEILKRKKQHGFSAVQPFSSKYILLQLLNTAVHRTHLCIELKVYYSQ